MMRFSLLGRRGKTKVRSRCPWRPEAVAALEGRALMAATPFDPSFGTGGVVVDNSNAAQADSVTAVTAVAVQPDGRIVTAEGAYDGAQGGTVPPLAIHRYNADGSVDATFGMGGQAVIPFPASDAQGGSTSNIVITPAGQIVLVAGTYSPSAQAVEDVVVRLTSTGALDSTFATAGEYTLPSGLSGANSVVVQASGRVVVAATLQSGFEPFSTVEDYRAVLLGLTPAGAIDTTFGTDGQAIFLPDNTTQYQAIALRQTPAGQLLAGFDLSFSSPGVSGEFSDETLTRLSVDGAIDTTFGTGGTVDVNPIPFGS